jgi:hypothetical protein
MSSLIVRHPGEPTTPGGRGCAPVSKIGFGLSTVWRFPDLRKALDSMCGSGELPCVVHDTSGTSGLAAP